MAYNEIKTVNILGDTAKEQWKNAINIYRLAIDSNLSQLKNMAEDEGYDDDEEYFDDDDVFAGDDKGAEYLDILNRLEYITNNVIYEMTRLVDALYAEESEE